METKDKAPIPTATRCNNAEHRRQRMMNQIAADLTPTGDGPEWIASTATLVLHYLAELAQLYNDNHPDDVITVMDISDVLTTAHYTLIASAEDD